VGWASGYDREWKKANKRIERVRKFYKRKIRKNNRIKEKQGRNLESWKVRIWINKITNEKNKEEKKDIR
jgi:hypothetical protein